MIVSACKLNVPIQRIVTGTTWCIFTRLCAKARIRIVNGAGVIQALLVGIVVGTVIWQRHLRKYCIYVLRARLRAPAN